MMDGTARKMIQPGLDRIGCWLARQGVNANHVTILACLLGLAAAGLIALGYPGVALVLIVISRIGDGLDGSVARASRKTDFGGFLDITLDFVFYGAIPLGFVLLDPEANGLAGAALIFAFYVNGASFLAYAVVAEKRGLSTAARGVKSIYFTTGLAEATETFVVFALFCLWPAWFSHVAWVFAAICLYTALSRIIQARAMFPDAPSEP
ncbi:CDP-alcohol phosphatidyltransferase family protein [Hoeflea sp. YIM 152468]|uniref:CDP-alcohol phosphatidyltransferase family protein n=1 Tax=Hoeflea sp. YIM 152468 TaxID=3031759 RepID=UPI0023DA9E6E|nr:CDP-alcohol phosphatidyltransferase family protein [Hoeflea sp. YIM 152468]MDF1608768.1 CDP-alcohol phosphatidyltransferase family protein [Hoeflea sp. YIM 152468]